jgi:hypothetical protein
MDGETRQQLITLADAAVAAVAEFRAEPAGVNGAPMLRLSTIAVAFPQ